MIRETRTILARREAHWPLHLGEPHTVRVLVDVHDGPRVDVSFMTLAAFRAYKESEAFEVYDALSRVAASAFDGEALLEPGDYLMMVRNRRWGLFGWGATSVSMALEARPLGAVAAGLDADLDMQADALSR